MRTQHTVSLTGTMSEPWLGMSYIMSTQTPRVHLYWEQLPYLHHLQMLVSEWSQ